MNKESSYFNSWLKMTPFMFIGVIISLYVVNRPMLENGLDNMFLMPLSFTLCIFVFPDIFFYHKGGYGLKILYIVMIAKYWILPMLQVTIGSFDGFSLPADTYEIAILVISMEVIVACTTIKLCYKKIQHKIVLQDLNDKKNDNKMHLGGFLIIVGLLAIIFIRGNANEILPAMRFFLAVEKLEKVPFDSYSIIALQTIKSFITLMVIGWASEKREKKDNKIYFVIALVVSALNCMIYFGDNRSSVLHTDIATIAVLMYAFKRERKFVYISIIPLAAVIMYSFIMIKQFGADVTQTTVSQTTSIEEITRTLNAYLCGVKNVATAIHKYRLTYEEFGFFNFMRDITDNIFLFKIPGFTFFNDAFNGFKTSIELYAGDGGAMLSLYGQMLYYGTETFAFLLDIVVYFFVIRALIYFDIKQKLQTEYSSIFIYTWLACLFGLFMCYCLITLLWSFSNTPFFLIILFYINKKIVYRRNE